MQDINKINPKVKNKLLNATKFSMVLLIAAILFISGAVSAIHIQGNSTKKIVKGTDAFAVPLLDQIKDMYRDYVPTSMPRTDWLQYDDGVWDNAFAPSSGVEMWCANRFTPTELVGLDGKQIESVHFATFCYPGDTQTDTGEIQIYDEGTSSAPGALLTSESFEVTATGYYTETWHEITLSAPVILDDTKDVWLCVYFDNVVSGTYPMSTDGAANYPEKSLWFSVDGSSWDDLTESYTTYNWMLRGQVEESVSYEHDVGIKSIDNPQTGAAFEDLPVEVTVKNYGENPEIDVPVKISIYKNSSLEYLDIEYVTVPVGVEKTVEFNEWTPNDWQVSENCEIDYELEAQLIFSDDNPVNNFKDETISLTYPFLHDTAVISIENPPFGRGIPAQTFPVKATIKNVGQYPSCCYLTNAKIGEKTYTNQWQTYEWSGTGEWLRYPYGSHSYEPSDCGCGDYYAACWYGSGKTFDTSFVTHALDLTSAGSSATVEVCEAFQDFAGYGYCEINVYSGGFDTHGSGSSYYEEQLYYATTDEIPRYGIFRQFAIDPANYTDPSEVYIEFYYSDDGYGNAWGFHIDCVAIPEIGFYESFESELFPPADFIVISEYDEDVAAVILDPGEEAILTFPQWTPLHLDTGISTTKEYNVKITSHNIDDTNPVNDIKESDLILDFYHEILIDEITQPSTGRDIWDLQFSFDVEAASGGAGNTGIEFDGTYFYTARWGSNLIHQYNKNGVLQKEFSIPGVSGLRDLAYCPLDGHFYGGAAGTTLWEMDFDSETLVNSFSMPVSVRSCAYDDDYDAFWVNNWGNDITLIDRSGTILDTIPNTISLYGSAWDGISEGGPYLWIFTGTSTGGGCQIEQYEIATGTITGEEHTVGLPGELIAGGLGATSGFVPGTYTLIALAQGDGGLPDTAFCYEVAKGGPSGGGWPPISLWLTPGTYQVQSIVKNQGTFPEEDLACSAEIMEFITDPYNGSSVYNDSVFPFDLNPLGGSKTCSFNNYDFALEGPYGLYVECALPVDDFPNNNYRELGIGIDNSKPTTVHTLSPATPDGENGWYVNDITVTLEANDGTDDWQSGIDVIQYKVGSGPVKTISGAMGSFIIAEDGDDIQVEYWAIDNVGNEESHHTFKVDLDQTPPSIELNYEIIDGNSIEGWTLEFNATVGDAMSGLTYVEFYLNDVLQDTDATGPYYTWNWKTHGGLKVTIKAIAYDDAGNNAYDEIVNPKSHNTHTQQYTQKPLMQKIMQLQIV